MLRHLALKDFAVVRAAELEFGDGMTVISGETGAGKSLLVDALGFLSGLRADSGVVRHGAERAELSAEFASAAGSPAQAWLADNELDDDGQCQLRRVIRADGGSRAWINGRSVTLSQLAELAGRLVEIHGQHEHQALLDRAMGPYIPYIFNEKPELEAQFDGFTFQFRHHPLQTSGCHPGVEEGMRIPEVTHSFLCLPDARLRPLDFRLRQ